MIKIAMVGNPNSGKTALINSIAKTDLEVGNWPGVTVEKKEVHFSYKNEKIYIVDLPGTYTLTPYSLEEKITRDFLIYENYDAIIDAVDITNLRRSLYLTLELIDMQKPIVLALNFFDVFTKEGYKIDIKRFEKLLDIKAVPTVASKSLGTTDLIEETIKIAKNRKIPKLQKYQHHLEYEINLIAKKLKNFNLNISKRFIAIKLLENDPFFIEKARNLDKNILKIADSARERLEAHMNLPIKTIITQSRYIIIDKILEKVLKKPIINKKALTQKIDNIVLNRFLGIPIFLLIMFLVFKITFDGSAPLIEWINNFFQNYLGKYLDFYLQKFLPDWFISLIIDGVINGVGLIISFLPLLIFLFFFMALLEESGYMARVSFLLDFLAKKLGIKGTSFISLILGFGCNVPAIYSTRTLTSFKERVITSLMIPFMSCSARLPVYALFTSIFFPNNGPMVIMSLYLLGIFVAFVYGYILNRVLVKQESKPFFLELPDYHMPTFLAIYNLMWPKLKDFIVRAGTVILLASVILWIFINLPPNSKPQESILAKSAQKIAPIFEPAGFGKNWEAVAALIPGTVAKEVVISSLGTIYASNIEKEENIYNFKEDSINIIISLKDAIADSVVSIFRFSKEEEESFESSLTQKIKNSFNPLSAFSYMIFVLLYIPCISTMAAIKHEFGTKWMIFESFLLLLIAYIVSTLFYQISTLVF